MPKIDTASSLEATTREFACPDVHIGGSEEESPYVPFMENVYIRHLAFDVRNGAFANILWVKKGGKLGRHRHRGPVFACTLEGSWRTSNTIGWRGREATSARIPEQFTRWFPTTPMA